jgi:hypothetical protein
VAPKATAGGKVSFDLLPSRAAPAGASYIADSAGAKIIAKDTLGAGDY